ncbi:chaperonin 10-like protein [Lipomyces arxii]|uniref:chaperonin 10-like protein n=1 Tax=Lipomyces arxii TaxID=56418 RepID=UPI0034CE1BCA
MKELIVYPNPLESQFVDSPIPEPGDDEVLIKVVVSGCNPKDWKYPAWQNKKFNSGDDIAGYIEKVGKNVFEFTKGDKVAAFHTMLTPYGSFAEYAISDAHTTFLLPESTSFEEAATIPLASLTAVYALFSTLKLPTPWIPATTEIPVFINGGSTAVGAFAIQLLKLANVGPIICTAGSAAKVAEEYGADFVIDYRGKSPEQVGAEVRSHLKPGQSLFKALDTVSENGSNMIMAAAVDNTPESMVVMVLPKNNPTFYEAQLINFKQILVSMAHGEEAYNRDLAYVFMRQFSKWLAEGKFKGHPYVVVEDGLAGVGKSLQSMIEGKVSGFKYVYKIADTPGL